MTKIVSASPRGCCGRGIVTIHIPEDEETSRKEETISKIVDGNLVGIQATDIDVQHKDNGGTRVICEHLSNGHGNPEQRGHCLKISEAIIMACNRVLTGKLLQNHGSKTYTETLPCKWVVKPIDEDENED